MSSINSTSNQTNVAYSQDSTTTASAKKADVDAFEAALNKSESEQLGVEETAEVLVSGMIKMSLGGVQELFRKQMLGKPEDKV